MGDLRLGEPRLKPKIIIIIIIRIIRRTLIYIAS